MYIYRYIYIHIYIHAFIYMIYLYFYLYVFYSLTEFAGRVSEVQENCSGNFFHVKIAGKHSKYYKQSSRGVM